MSENLVLGSSDGEYDTYNILFYCDYIFDIEDIRVKDGLVVDWGEFYTQ